MNLYNKKLHNVTDLRKEKEMLKRQLLKMENEPLLPDMFESLGNHQAGKSNAGSVLAEGLGLLTSLLPEGSNLGEMVMSFVANKGESLGSAVKPIVKKAVIPVVKEVIGGYLKWKAVEWSINGVRKIVQRSAAKKSQTAKSTK